MSKNRMESFSDGVIAIIITIMVLELKVPRGENFQALAPLIPVFLSYVLSFVYVGIYWNNHHHMLHTSDKVTGSMLWANLHLLFWLSLFPFATGWMGENHLVAATSAFYGVVLLMAAVAYWILQQLIIASQGRDSLCNFEPLDETPQLPGNVAQLTIYSDLLDQIEALCDGLGAKWAEP